MSITVKAIQTLYSRPNDTSLRPVLQVLSVSALAGQTGRFKIVLSDGEHYSTGLLSSQLIAKLGGCPFKQFQLVCLDDYVVNSVQDKVFLLVHGLTEVSPPLPTGQVGQPQGYRPVSSMNPATIPVPQQHAVPVTSHTLAAHSSNPYANPGPIANATTAFINPYPPQPAQSGNPYIGQPYVGQPLPNHSPFAVGMQQAVPQQAHQTNSGPVRYLQPVETIVPMSQLTIYTQKWTIKARVSNKSDMRAFRNAKGEGQLMTVDLVDGQNCEMRATFFGSAAQKFYPLLQLGKVYTLARGSVKPANPKFNPKAQYELMFDENSEIVQVADDMAIPSMKLNLTPISAISATPIGETVDIAGIVLSAGEVSQVTVKSTGRETSRRNITIGDESGSSVDLTIWGDKALRFGAAEMAGSPVIFVKQCRVGDYNGRSLSTSASSLVELDPDHQKGFELKAWWMREGSTAQFVALSSSATSTASGSGPNSRTTIQAMRQEDTATLGVLRPANSHLVKATVVHVPVRDTIYYKSCVSEVDDGRGGRRMCQKKVELQGDTYLCADQHPNRDCNARFLLSLKIQDATGECHVRTFHEQAKAVLGVDAPEIDGANDPVVAQQNAVESVQFKPFMFKIRSKKETHQDEEKVNMIVSEASPVVPSADARFMLSNINRYLAKVGGS